MRNIAYFLIVIALGSFLLVKGSALFVPLAYALFISFLLYPFSRWMESKGLQRPASVSLAVLAFVLVMLLLIAGFVAVISALAAEWPLIHLKLTELIARISATLSAYLGWTDAELHDRAVAIFTNKSGDIMQAGQNIVFIISEGIVFLVLIPVYVFLLLFYRHKLVDALLLFIPDYKRNSFKEVLELSISTYYNFIKGMMVVYIMVGILNSIGLLIIGVPHPFFFGMLTAVMTFIPYLGIIMAGSLPVVYAWMTFGTIWQPLSVVGVFVFVQYLEANVIFPWAVGRRLEMNTLATLVVIVMGGILWGASGMILFVPFAAILKLIADRMPGREWKAVAGLLGT
jgi:predicted PurR-regulated permease PerM